MHWVKVIIGIVFFAAGVRAWFTTFSERLMPLAAFVVAGISAALITLIDPVTPSRMFDWGVIMVVMASGGLLFHFRDTPKTALDLFKSRSPWKRLPAEFQARLADRLQSKKQALRFAQICERTQTLGVALDKLGVTAANNPESAIGEFAWSLSALAGTMNPNTSTEDAKQTLKIASLLIPRRPILWYSLAVWSWSKGTPWVASFWAGKVLSFEPSGLAATLAQEDALIREMAKKTGNPLPEMVSAPQEPEAWSAIIAQMREITAQCAAGVAERGRNRGT